MSKEAANALVEGIARTIVDEIGEGTTISYDDLHQKVEDKVGQAAGITDSSEVKSIVDGVAEILGEAYGVRVAKKAQNDFVEAVQDALVETGLSEKQEIFKEDIETLARWVESNTVFGYKPEGVLMEVMDLMPRTINFVASINHWIKIHKAAVDKCSACGEHKAKCLGTEACFKAAGLAKETRKAQNIEKFQIRLSDGRFVEITAEVDPTLKLGPGTAIETVNKVVHLETGEDITQELFDISDQYFWEPIYKELEDQAISKGLVMAKKTREAQLSEFDRLQLHIKLPEALNAAGWDYSIDLVEKVINSMTPTTVKETRALVDAGKLDEAMKIMDEGARAAGPFLFARKAQATESEQAFAKDIAKQITDFAGDEKDVGQLIEMIKGISFSKEEKEAQPGIRPMAPSSTPEGAPIRGGPTADKKAQPTSYGGVDPVQDEKDWNDITRMLEEGKSIEEIGSYFGMTSEDVNKFIDFYGLEKKALSDQQIGDIMTDIRQDFGEVDDANLAQWYEENEARLTDDEKAWMKYYMDVNASRHANKNPLETEIQRAAQSNMQVADIANMLGISQEIVQEAISA